MTKLVSGRWRKDPVTLDYLFDRAQPEPNSGCWLWLGATRGNGYPAIRIQGKNYGVHQISHVIYAGGQLDSSMDTCHKCDTRLCINPAHLFRGTRADNLRDCANKDRNTFGEKSNLAKLTSKQAVEIRNDNRSTKEISKAFNISTRAVRSIKSGEAWRRAK